MDPHLSMCLNAPYGAPCFLTWIVAARGPIEQSLNAPYGAPCFLTVVPLVWQHGHDNVLMHLMALGAF